MRLVAGVACACAIGGWPAAQAPTLPYPVVFVSRQIPAQGSIYWSVPRDLPGVGPHSRFRVAAPGRLQVLDTNGSVRTLVDGATPTPTSLSLVDVNAPDVSYDGQTIVFAGLPAGSYASGPTNDPGAWRLYAINVDGSGLRAVTTSSQNLDVSQFGDAGGALRAYDDTDPAWLPDGRIVFASTRWPAFAHYSGVRASNLHVVNADGSGLHRITAERNGADRPLVDPLTGRIVFARWWRNHRFAVDSFAEVADPAGGFRQKDGLTTDRTNHVGGADALFRNAWQIAAINPDGTGLAMWAGTQRDEEANHAYGGGFSPGGEFFANYYPMYNMTEAAGFGGIRRYRRGPGRYTPVLGITTLTLDYVSPANPTSYGIFRGSYATDAEVLPDGRLLLSWAADVNQDYDLYVANADGTNRVPLLTRAGTTEVRARAVRPRPLPPVIADQAAPVASLLPPAGPSTYAQDGTFTFDALNVYGNGPVDSDIVDAPAVGSATAIRFYLDHQRTSPGSFPNLDWPVLLGTAPVSADGAVRQAAPANVPLFEQLRSAGGTVPLTCGPRGVDGAAHVAGLNYGRQGEVARCIGCHAGHSMIPLPAQLGDARWSNLAPGAVVTVSSSRDVNQNRGLVDRRVMNGEIWRYWTSQPGQTAGQWVQLTFPVPVQVRTVRLYNPRQGGEANSTISVQNATVQLFVNANATGLVASLPSGPLSVAGTDVRFPDVRARSVRVRIDAVNGTFYGASVASLAEIEVIAAGLPDQPLAPANVRIVR